MHEELVCNVIPHIIAYSRALSIHQFDTLNIYLFFFLRYVLCIYPVVFLSEFLGLLLVGQFVRLGQFAPHLAQLLGTVSYRQAGVLLLDTGSVLTAEHKER